MPRFDHDFVYFAGVDAIAWTQDEIFHKRAAIDIQTAAAKRNERKKRNDNHDGADVFLK